MSEPATTQARELPHGLEGLIREAIAASARSGEAAMAAARTVSAASTGPGLRQDALADLCAVLVAGSRHAAELRAAIEAASMFAAITRAPAAAPPPSRRRPRRPGRAPLHAV
jgi:hypothetical protein